MPVDIIWRDGDATVHILCDGCDKEYDVYTDRQYYSKSISCSNQVIVWSWCTKNTDPKQKEKLGRRWKYASKYSLGRWRCYGIYIM